MNKQTLVQMIIEYVDFKQSITKAYYERNNSPQAEDAWLDLLASDDDQWQKLIHFIYSDHDENFSN